jgi:glycosyltransferase involved in cell wall biosynthesis
MSVATLHVPGVRTPSPSLSVVIPCRNAGLTLAAQLSALTGQSGGPAHWEVVVADNGSTDDSRQIAEDWPSLRPPVRVVPAHQKAGINYARNTGVQASRGQYVLCCDADDIVEPGWLDAMWRAFEGGALLVGGTVQRVVPGIEAGVSLDNAIQDSLGYLPWPQGANCGFKRSVYDALGGFDETYRGGGDETDFFWRAQLDGYSLVHVGEATVRYVQRRELRALYRQNYHYGRSHVVLFNRFNGRGMPRSSLFRAALFWFGLPVRAAIGAPSEESRRAFVRRLGIATGRLVNSVRLRTVYL